MISVWKRSWTFLGVKLQHFGSERDVDENKFYRIQNFFFKDTGYADINSMYPEWQIKREHIGFTELHPPADQCIARLNFKHFTWFSGACRYTTLNWRYTAPV